jgi:hypothetical protein
MRIAAHPQQLFPRKLILNYNDRAVPKPLHSGQAAGENVMPNLTRPRFISLSAFVFLLSTSSVALAQHDAGGITGGGMIGGSTSRPSTKPASKPATKPAATNHSHSDYDSSQTPNFDNIDERRRLLPARRSSLQSAKV